MFFDRKTVVIMCIVIVLHIISYKAYMWSVYTPSDQNWINYHMFDLALAVNIGIVCAMAAVFLMWARKKSKLLLALQLAFIYYMVTRDLGWDLVHHGGWNLAYFLIFTVSCLSVIGIAIAVAKIWKLNNYGKIAVIVIVLVCVVWVWHKQSVVSYNTKIWRRAFQGMELSNDKGYCRVNFEDRAYPDGYDGVFMFWEKLMPEEGLCRIKQSQFQVTIEQERQLSIACPGAEAEVHVLPSFELWDKEMRRGGKIELSEKVDRAARKLKVKMTNGRGSLDISGMQEEAFRVYCNGESRLESRVVDFRLQNKAEADKQPLPKSARTPFNILIVYIDAVSRRNLQRQLTKTTELLNDKAFFDQHNTTMYQMLKFHSVYTSTTDNLKALFSGITSLRTISREQSKQKRPEFE